MTLLFIKQANQIISWGQQNLTDSSYQKTLTSGFLFVDTAAAANMDLMSCFGFVPGLTIFLFFFLPSAFSTRQRHNIKMLHSQLINYVNCTALLWIFNLEKNQQKWIWPKIWVPTSYLLIGLINMISFNLAISSIIIQSKSSVFRLMKSQTAKKIWF